MNITYSREAEDFILEALGLGLGEAGHVLYNDGTYVGTHCGKDSIRVDDVGMYVHVEDAPQKTKIVCNNIGCFLEWQRRNR